MGLRSGASPRMAWAAAMVAVLALVLVTSVLIVDGGGEPSTEVIEDAAGGGTQPTGTTYAADGTSNALEEDSANSVTVETEPRDLCNTTPPHTADPFCPGYVDTIVAATVTTTGAGPAEEPVLCDTTPPLTADPSCLGYVETTVPTTNQVTTGTARPPPAEDGCGQHPGLSSTTTAPPHCTGETYPTTTDTDPGPTTDICDPNAVPTTHPSCVGDPSFCGAITTVPTCPAPES